MCKIGHTTLHETIKTNRNYTIPLVLGKAVAFFKSSSKFNQSE